MKARRAVVAGGFVLMLAVLTCLLLAVPAFADERLVKDEMNQEPQTLAPGVFQPAGGDVLIIDSSKGSTIDAMASLDRLGYTYDHVQASEVPDAATAAEYSAILCLGYRDATTLKSYLDAGARIAFFDYDLGYYRNSDPLYSQYLEASYGSDAGSDGPITGLDIMDGVDIDISADPYPDSFTITGPNAVPIFQNTSPRTGYAGLRIEKNGYRVVYCAWHFINTGSGDADQDAVLGRALGWLLSTTARGLQNAATNDLRGLYDTYGGRQLNMALSYASGALGGGLWLDDTHLVERRGSAFFQYQLSAIRLLTAGRNPWMGLATPIVQDLVAVAAELAATAIEDALAAGGNASLIEAAQSLLALGDSYAAANMPAAAVSVYASAWKAAVSAY